MADCEEDDELPDCVNPDYHGKPCALAELELPEDAMDAWAAYAYVAKEVDPWTGLLNTSGVITVLDRLGLSPDEPGEMAQFLDDLSTIHNARREVLKKDKKRDIGGE